MNTEIFKIDEEDIDIDKIKYSADVIKNGGLVVFPTETVYGLGANGLNETAVRNIYKAKGRPSDNPLILHISKIEEVEPLVENVTKMAEILVQAFCPGPITFILRRSKRVPDAVTGGLDTVALRIPNNKIALKLIEESKMPLAAPSANISGKPSPTCAQHVIDDLYERVDIIIDGGCTSVGVESTVVDLSEDVPVILRPGKITLEDLKKVLGEVEIDKSLLNKNENIVAKAPGMKYRHYAPTARLVIVKGSIGKTIEKINILAIENINEGKKVGIICTDETKSNYKYGITISLGDRSNIEEIASNLFTILRQFDSIGVDLILSESFSQAGVGMAVMNRLMKAAGYNIINV